MRSKKTKSSSACSVRSTGGGVTVDAAVVFTHDSERELIRFVECPPPPNPMQDTEKAVDDLLDKLKGAAQTCGCEQAAAIVGLVRVAVGACRYLEALYSEERCRPLVEAVAGQCDHFATSFDCHIPSALRDKARPCESSGDRMRRALSRQWSASFPLGATGKTEFDCLRLVMEGFVRSVQHPLSTRETALAADLTPLDRLLEIRGVVPVGASVRANLLCGENQRNAVVWAREFVEWYKARHPWPFMDRHGRETLPRNRGELRDPIHVIAFERLAKRRKTNDKEKSPWNALRQVAGEKFRAAFKPAKVESD